MWVDVFCLVTKCHVSPVRPVESEIKVCGDDLMQGRPSPLSHSLHTSQDMVLPPGVC